MFFSHFKSLLDLFKMIPYGLQGIRARPVDELSLESVVEQGVLQDLVSRYFTQVPPLHVSSEMLSLSVSSELKRVHPFL